MAETLTITCLDPGGGAFLVDDRRFGQRALGVPAGGPADARSLAAANRLLGQRPLHTGIEFTQTGGRWLLSGRGQFVLTGADVTWRANGRILETYYVHDLEGDALLTGEGVKRSGALSAGQPEAGLRAYLAINGNWGDAPATDGYDHLSGALSPGWSAAVSWTEEAPFASSLDVRRHLPPQDFLLPVVPGPEWGELPIDEQRRLLKTEYRVDPRSNRQGIRLSGGAGYPSAGEMLSSPVLPGTVQLSPAGPILLGPEAQTLGGYPRVLLVAKRRALAMAFQVRPGQKLRFRMK